MKRRVFKRFLKIEGDTPVLMTDGSLFHQQGTANQNSLALFVGVAMPDDRFMFSLLVSQFTP